VEVAVAVATHSAVVDSNFHFILREAFLVVDLTEVFLVVINSIFDIGETKGLFSAVANTGGFVSSVLTNLTNTNRYILGN
jgi:ATP/ADP translocase